MAERIKEHPILGIQEKRRSVTFTFDGKELTGGYIVCQSVAGSSENESGVSGSMLLHI